VIDPEQGIQPHPGAFLVVRDSTLDSVVTISVGAGAPGELFVEATWDRAVSRSTVSATVDGFGCARTLAHEWADQRSVGIEPSGTNDRSDTS